ncbi:Phox homologous domain [Pseudocohnilembus persalinus]|uniref:Phox homologous domain n=1 Tax=Pseudocohnilembus persalinus TaxID=266149 RepID=A0A0V0QC03_PSEPJ|nr:Phox homologous domain [Pseudocohnilembus persalinus]|eukprot:KRW99773.1 Phox homologous domain [Pseudocohnilembus persalinus]
MSLNGQTLSINPKQALITQPFIQIRLIQMKNAYKQGINQNYDLFAKIGLDLGNKYQTRGIQNSADPIWKQQFDFTLEEFRKSRFFNIIVYDHINFGSDEFMGNQIIPTNYFISQFNKKGITLFKFSIVMDQFYDFRKEFFENEIETLEIIEQNLSNTKYMKEIQYLVPNKKKDTQSRNSENSQNSMNHLNQVDESKFQINKTQFQNQSSQNKSIIQNDDIQQQSDQNQLENENQQQEYLEQNQKNESQKVQSQNSEIQALKGVKTSSDQMSECQPQTQQQQCIQQEQKEQQNQEQIKQNQNQEQQDQNQNKDQQQQQQQQNIQQQQSIQNRQNRQNYILQQQQEEKWENRTQWDENTCHMSLEVEIFDTKDLYKIKVEVVAIKESREGQGGGLFSGGDKKVFFYELFIKRNDGLCWRLERRYKQIRKFREDLMQQVEEVRGVDFPGKDFMLNLKGTFALTGPEEFKVQSEKRKQELQNFYDEIFRYEKIYSLECFESFFSYP